MDDIIALEKYIDLTTGAKASYWKPTGLVYVETEPYMRVYLAGYLDRAANDSGKTPAALVQIDLTEEQTDTVRATKQFPTKPMLLNFVSANPLFKDAARIIGPVDPVPPTVKKGKTFKGPDAA